MITIQYVTNAGLEMTLEALSKTEYCWEELQQRPLPDGVDPAKLEQYLSGTDFKVKTKLPFLPRIWYQDGFRNCFSHNSHVCLDLI